jgi:antirestriction protein
LEELPDYLLDDLDSFVSYYGSLEELVEHKDDIILYSGCETMTDLAYYLIDEEQVLGEIPSSLQNYIDYEAYGRDLDIEGTFIATNAGICEVLR